MISKSTRTAPCELCQRTEFEIVDTRDRHAAPLSTVICRHCGLISHEVIPSDTQVAAYYARHYREDYHGQKAPAAHRVLRAWAGGEWLLRQLAPYLQTNDVVGEIGAGIGCTVKVFEQAGYESTGIEPGHEYCDFAKHKLGARLQRKELFELAAVASYDVLLLVHVIEHFNSPMRALVHLRQLLKPGGRLYVECPNIGAPHAAPGRQFHSAHIYNFTPHTLVWMANASGLKVRAQLSDATDRNLRFIFERDGAPRTVEMRSGYQKTLNSLRRVGPIGYHLRPSYLLDRVCRDTRFVSSRFAAKWRLKRLIRRLDGSASHGVSTDRNRVAERKSAA